MTLARGKAILDRIGQDHHAVHPPVIGAEIGVARGELSAYLLSHNYNLTLLMIDPWMAWPDDSAYHRWGIEHNDGYATGSQDDHDARYAAACTAVAEFGKRATVWRQASEEAARHVDEQSLDFVFLDADHSYEGCSRDIALWSPKVRCGGLLCGHDIDRPEHNDDGVRRAIEGFGRPFDMGEDHTWFVRLDTSLVSDVVCS